jgi:hypothetical protein
MRTSSGIYVEIEIQDDLDHVWLLIEQLRNEPDPDNRHAEI